MRRIAIAVLAVAVLVGFSAALMAQDAPALAKPAMVAGKLTKIDGKSLTITTTKGDKTRDTVITCNDATKFAREGDAAGAPAVTFADLKVGQQVKATYTKGDTNIAVKVSIAKAEAAPSVPK